MTSENKSSKEKLLPKEKQLYYEVFKMFDISSKGSFGVKELSEKMTFYGLKSNEQEVLEMILCIDTGGSGRISFEDFLDVFLRRMKDSTEAEEELREAFKVFDKEGNGFLPVKKFRDVMTKVGDKLTEEEVDEMVRECESDNDRDINYEEFITIMSSAHK